MGKVGEHNVTLRKYFRIWISISSTELNITQAYHCFLCFLDIIFLSDAIQCPTLQGSRAQPEMCVPCQLCDLYFICFLQHLSLLWQTHKVISGVRHSRYITRTLIIMYSDTSVEKLHLLYNRNISVYPAECQGASPHNYFQNGRRSTQPTSQWLSGAPFLVL